MSARQSMWTVGRMACLIWLSAGCDSTREAADGGSAEPGRPDLETAEAVATGTGPATGAVQPESEGTADQSRHGGAPHGPGSVLDEVPDACRLLSPADAEALLGEPTGNGRSHEVVRSIDDLGVRAALFRSPEEPCGERLSLWVATDVQFEDRIRPGLIREVTGRIHLVIFLHPPGNPGSSGALLRTAAEVVLSGLEERASS